MLENVILEDEQLRSHVSYFSTHTFKLFLCVIATSLMIAMPFYYLLNNLTLSTHFEESIGFRYFHSLRIAYGHEYPWLPQGQLPGIFHIALQKIITCLGHPISEIFPRVNIFSNIATIFPLITAGCIHFWAIKPIKHPYFQAFFTFTLIAIFFSPRFQDGWMLLPDYHIWIVSLSILGAGWALRLLKPDTPLIITNKSYILLGIYAGVCLGVKITLITYPAVIGVIFLSIQKNYISSTLKIILISIPLALLLWMSVLLTYYDFHISVLQSHFINLFEYTDSQVKFDFSKSLEFCKSLIPISLADYNIIVTVVLVYSVWSFFKYGFKHITSALLPIILLELYMLYQRNYTHTNIEVQYLFFIIGVIYSISLYKNNHVVHSSIDRILKYQKSSIIFSITSVIMMATSIPLLRYTLERLPTFNLHITEYNTASSGLHSSISNNEKTLFLIPSINSVDQFNLHTIDNGMFKASAGLSPEWKKSSFIATIFDNRWVAGDAKTLPASLVDYRNLVFRTGSYETLAEALTRLENYYQTSFNDYNCNVPFYSYQFKVTNEKQILVLCKRSALTS